MCVGGLGRIEVGVQLFFGNEPTGLTNDGSEGAHIQTRVGRNRQDLSSVRARAFQFHMAASLCYDKKPERFEDGDNLVPRQPTKLGHRRDQLRG